MGAAGTSDQAWTLITGASAGIGLELARVFGQNGHPLLLVARDVKRLSALKKEIHAMGVACEIIALDLTAPGAAQTLLERAEGKHIDCLVNNAGFGLNGAFSKNDLEKELQMIQLNVSVLTSLTKLFLRGMLEKRSGKILNVASTAAFQPGPFMAVYYATKAYVLSFSEALSEELRGTGVTVTTLCPGPTRTEFATRAGALRANMFKSPIVMDARPVAEAGYRATMAGRRLAIAGLANSLMATSVRFLPRPWVTSLARRITLAAH